MKKIRRRRKSPLPYLLLNIFVSALTTLVVLWLWTRAQEFPLIEKPAPLETGFSYHPTPTQTLQASVPIPPEDQIVVEIQNVFGVGDIENEVVILKRIGEDELWMNDWILKDEGNNVFTFNQLVMNKDGSIQIYTRAGHDTVTELFWGLEDPIWQTGETATLTDSKGIMRATYTIE